MESSSQNGTAPHFNLIAEPWIPVFRPGHATSHAELGIRDVIAKAGEIRCLADSSPIVNFALLLARASCQSALDQIDSRLLAQASVNRCTLC